jgi:hypothetical protein
MTLTYKRCYCYAHAQKIPCDRSHGKVVYRNEQRTIGNAGRKKGILLRMKTRVL